MVRLEETAVGLEIDHLGDILCALHGREAIFREPCKLPERRRASWRDGDLTASEGDHALNVTRLNSSAGTPQQHRPTPDIPPL